jgi:hypothetical protein
MLLHGWSPSETLVGHEIGRDKKEWEAAQAISPMFGFGNARAGIHITWANKKPGVSSACVGEFGTSLLDKQPLRAVPLASCGPSQ